MSKVRALSKAVAVCLILSPMLTLSACATFEQVQPKTAREALAESEILFAGVIDMTRGLYASGVISKEQLNATYIPAFDKIATALNTAEIALKVADNVAAVAAANDAASQLDAMVKLLTAINSAKVSP